MAERAVVPMRFGTRLPDPDAVRAALGARREGMLDALDRVRGRVELAVRAMQAAPAPATGGREFLSTRRSVAGLHDSLAALAVDARRLPERTPAELLRASYLVERPALERFVGAVEELKHGHPEAALLCTGPWPPYSFIEPPTG